VPSGRVHVIQTERAGPAAERCWRGVSRANFDRSATRRSAAVGLSIHSIGDGAVSLRVKLDPVPATITWTCTVLATSPHPTRCTRPSLSGAAHRGLIMGHRWNLLATDTNDQLSLSFLSAVDRGM
jgi:hypothetical protein